MEYTYALSRNDLLPVSGNTPYGLYDNDPQFCDDAQKTCFYVTTRLGFGSVDIELIDKQIYAAYEEAVTTYGNEVYLYNIRENFLSMRGNSTSVGDVSTSIIKRHPGPVIKIAESFGDIAGLGNTPKYSSSIDLVAGQQKYDLKTISVSGSWPIQNKDIQVTRVFYEDLPAIALYNNPFPGLGGVASYPGGWGLYNGYSGINTMVWPIYFDIQRVQQIEMSRNVRSSGHSFNINNNVLEIYPIPTTPGKLWLEYMSDSALQNGTDTIEDYGAGGGTITNVSNAPTSNPVFSQINTVGRTWIMKYALALCKDTLGHVRGKYPAVDIPKVGAMSSSDLFTDSRAEREALLVQLRELLDMTSQQKQMERQVQEAEYAKKVLNDIPLDSTIYIL